jgi:hypothetical protein
MVLKYVDERVGANINTATANTSSRRIIAEGAKPMPLHVAGRAVHSFQSR